MSPRIGQTLRGREPSWPPIPQRCAPRRWTLLARAIELDPYEPLVRRAVADTAFLLGDCDRALSEILTAYTLSKGDDRYIGDLERAAECSTDLDAARQLLTGAIGVAEKAPLYASLAIVELRANEHEAARSSALRALELDPANTTAHAVLDAIGP